MADGVFHTAPEETDSTRSHCFHCGLPLPARIDLSVVIDGIGRPMCCVGCAAVASCIVESGFEDYYRSRSGFGAKIESDALVPPELELYDRDQMPEKFGADTKGGEAIFSIDGIRCAACVWLIERKLARLPGVQAVELNVSGGRLQVRWDRQACRPSDILKAIREVGYTAYPFDPAKHGERLEQARKKMFRQLFIAGLSMMQVMMYAIPAYLATDGTMDRDMAGLMRWAGLLLTLPALLYSAQPFFKGAWNDLRNRMPGMDVPVVLGIVAAFGASVVATLRGSGEVYFDSVTMFVFLLLCSRYLELAARRKAASTLDNLQRVLPVSALRMPGYPLLRDTEMVAASQLRRDDVVLVRPGEALVADGVILEGDTEVDLSLLTGESRAQWMAAGANLPGGAVNATQPILVRITKSAADSTLAMLMKLIQQAGQGKPRLALWADRVAVWFVAALLLLAVAAFATWHYIDPSRAWSIAIAVVVVSCPCALSLATPTALAAATDRLLRQGVLVVRSHVLETLQRATYIVFDKTGTLTVGRPALLHIEKLDFAQSEWCLHVAAALEASSTHPLSRAILEAAAGRDMTRFADQAAEEVMHVAGQGLEGMVGGVRYRLGCVEFVGALTSHPPLSPPSPDLISIYLGTPGAWLARFDFADRLRDDARQVVQFFLSAGKTVILLSGDHQDVAQAVAAKLNINTALGQCLPEHKLAFVQGLQRDGAIVAMVGDGVNDAAVLSAADVSFAMGGGTALAQTHADCVLMSGRLSSLCEVADVAARTVAVVRQNLYWAVFYNLIAIPAAAFGLLNPWLSGIGMSLSSAAVVLNALRLRRIASFPVCTAAPASPAAIRKTVQES